MLDNLNFHRTMFFTVYLSIYQTKLVEIWHFFQQIDKLTDPQTLLPIEAPSQSLKTKQHKGDLLSIKSSQHHVVTALLLESTMPSLKSSSQCHLIKVTSCKPCHCWTESGKKGQHPWKNPQTISLKVLICYCNTKGGLQNYRGIQSPYLLEDALR